jgi:hypothetical protein
LSGNSPYELKKYEFSDYSPRFRGGQWLLHPAMIYRLALILETAQHEIHQYFLVSHTVSLLIVCYGTKEDEKRKRRNVKLRQI